MDVLHKQIAALRIVAGEPSVPEQKLPLSVRRELDRLRELRDLWHFAMHEAPEEFAGIVASCPPQRWLDETLRLRRRAG